MRTVRRSALHQAIATEAARLARAGCPTALRGRTRLRSRNSIYEFLDGTCCRITTPSGVNHAAGASLLGMRIVGWLTSDDGQPAITTVWTAGAVAILCCDWAGSIDDVAVALTSSTVRFALIDDARLPWDLASDDLDDMSTEWEP
jgi:hypothetical protein